MGGNQSTCTKQRKAPWEHASVWKMFSSVIDRQCRLTIARTCDMNPARFQLFVKLLVHYIKLSQNSNSKIWAWTLALLSTWPLLSGTICWIIRWNYIQESEITRLLDQLIDDVIKQISNVRIAKSIHNCLFCLFMLFIHYVLSEILSAEAYNSELIIMLIINYIRVLSL